MQTGYLVLENGDVFEGQLIGDSKESAGEVVFNTSMTGYQEILTDPSYTGQIMTFCYPLIGNYGINMFDNESLVPHLSGAIISDLCMTPSHYQSVKTFAEHLDNADIPCLAGVDTRAIVKRIRQHGTMKGVITETLKSFNKNDFEWMTGLSLIESASNKKVETFGKGGPHIVLVDYGHKHSIVQALVKEGCYVTVVPYSTTFATIKKLNPDGVVLSNGPGDPTALAPMFKEIKQIIHDFPTLGICLGHQLIALVSGAKTEKLLFGHRGSNHPVKEVNTGKVWMTSQNHSYVVVDDSVDEAIFDVSYRNINDGSIEGLKHKHLPVETVQFHPEAHPGPEDTFHVFNGFINNIKEQMGEKTYAITS